MAYTARRVRASRRRGPHPARDKLQLVIKDLPRPNGIAFSPDEKFLYIADSGKKVWMRYRVQPDGSVTDGMVFLDPHVRYGEGRPRRYAAGQEWKHLQLGAGRGLDYFCRKASTSGPSRFRRWSATWAWGEKDGKTLYITGSTSIYRIKVSVEGDRKH